MRGGRGGLRERGGLLVSVFFIHIHVVFLSLFKISCVLGGCSFGDCVWLLWCNMLCMYVCVSFLPFCFSLSPFLSPSHFSLSLTLSLSVSLSLSDTLSLSHLNFFSNILMLFLSLLQRLSRKNRKSLKPSHLGKQREGERGGRGQEEGILRGRRERDRRRGRGVVERRREREGVGRGYCKYTHVHV